MIKNVYLKFLRSIFYVSKRTMKILKFKYDITNSALSIILYSKPHRKKYLKTTLKNDKSVGQFYFIVILVDLRKMRQITSIVISTKTKKHPRKY